MTDQDKQEESISQETIDKAIDVLQKAVNVVSKDGNIYKDRRSGDDRRKSILVPYFKAFVKKMLENFSSAKMLIFFFPLLTSLFFLWKLFGMRDEFMRFVITHPDAASDLTSFFKVAMDGFIAWCTFTVSLGGTVIVVRETFKVSKLKALKDDTKDTTYQIENMVN